MSFLLFILFILILMIGIPLLRGWLYMQNVRRRVNETFGGGRQNRDNGDRYEQDEYADFEEMSGTIVEDTTPSDDTRTVVEEQIIDAEYEEIP